MTRKDYRLIAQSVMEVRSGYEPWDLNFFRALDDVVESFSAKLSENNPSFDTEKFKTAAGYKTKGDK